MTTVAVNQLVRQLRQVVLRQGDQDLTDGDLLKRFLAAQDEAAFAVLVRRHGPMVMGVCRRILHHHPDAEDAFQATFLVLARKAGGLWVRGSLGPWLLSVARRVASCARTDASRQRAHERTAAERAAHRGRQLLEKQSTRFFRYLGMVLTVGGFGGFLLFQI